MDRPKSDTLTLELMGEVTLADLAVAIGELRAVVDALTSELGGEGEAPQWLIEDLHPGSATAVIRGRGDADAVDRVVRAYEDVGEALETNKPIPHGRRVGHAARRIARLANGNGRISVVRFETPARDFFVAGARPEPAPPAEEAPKPEPVPEHPQAAPQPTPHLSTQGPESSPGPPAIASFHVVEAWGAVEGRLQTLSNREGLRFTLYDTLHDHGVGCYLDPSFPQDEMREKWGLRARVEGWVKRVAGTGRPVNIRRVRRIDVLSEPGAVDFRQARGVLPFDAKKRSEEVIRELRDA